MTSPNLAGLKPCPFCGGPAKEFMKLVGCEPCALARRDAASWNTRAALRTVSDELGAGWKIVPIEPTEAMLNAPLPEGSSITGVKFESRRDLRPLIYRTMIEATPDPAIPADTQSREGEKP